MMRPSYQTAATSNLLAAEERVRRSEISLVKSSDEVRACQLNRTNLKSRAQDLKDRRDKSKNTLSQIDLIALEKTVNLSKSARDKANIENETSKILFHEAEKKLDEASSIAELSFEKKHASETEITRLQAEIDALRYLLSDDLNENERPVIDQLKVLEGMEAALSSALADELSAPVGRGSTKFYKQCKSNRLGPPPHKVTHKLHFWRHRAQNCIAGVGVIDDIEMPRFPAETFNRSSCTERVIYGGGMVLFGKQLNQIKSQIESANVVALQPSN